MNAELLEFELRNGKEYGIQLWKNKQKKVGLLILLKTKNKERASWYVYALNRLIQESGE